VSSPNSEQRAAAALLAQLAATEDEDDAGEWVSDDEAAHLRTRNPKGQLFEHCARAHLPSTHVEVRPIVTPRGPGFEATAHLPMENDDLWGDVRRAATAKLAEQAAAASLLARLHASASPASPEPAPIAATEPRSVLNEMRQKNAICDYGFVPERIEGPPHAPVFHMGAFALSPEGARVEVRGVPAPSKKEGERRAAAELLEKLAK
jgi:hypothetical protein